MRTALPLLCALVGSAVACNLNPQPLPPDDPDATTGLVTDMASDGGPGPEAAAASDDAGINPRPPGASWDGGPTEGGHEAGPIEVDASADGGDAGDEEDGSPEVDAGTIEAGGCPGHGPGTLIEPP